MNLMERMVEQARANKQRIVLPEGTEERTLQAADRILADNTDNVISNQDGGNHAFIFFCNFQGFGCSLVAVICHILHTNFIDAVQRCLRCGEKRRKRH